MNTMKRRNIAIVVFSVLFFGMAQSQEVNYGESFELNGTLNPNQSVEYKAKDFICLKKGFRSFPQSPNYAMMEIDPYFNPTTPYGAMYWEPEDSSIKGRLGFYPMDFKVNDNGAAVISMPLEFPEGINGMTPHLSLEYNSQGGNGILGLGWSLGGMSKISRVPYTYMYDDSCHSVKFSNTDELSLDGIVLRKGNKNGVICYYPEIYDYSIVYPINSDGSIDNGFRVLKKDGNVYTYDAKNYLQSTISTPIEWHLSRVEDPFGNYIEYNYYNNRVEGAFYPTAIYYTGHAGLEPMYEIHFEYDEDERDDCPPKYFSRPDSPNPYTGFSRITKKINNIQCLYKGNKIVSYNLSYNTLDWNIRALSSVAKQFFDYNGAKWSYNLVIPTEFQWKGTDYHLKYENALDENGISVATNYNFLNEWHQFAAFAVRLEHDGLSGLKFEQDIVHLMTKDIGSRKYYLSVFRNNNFIDESGQQYYFDSYDCSSINHPQNGIFADNRDIRAFMPTDTDGDGLNEIMCASYYSSGRVSISLIKHNSPGGFYEDVIIPSLSCSDASDFTDFLIGDFNGDGLSDLFFMYRNIPHIYISTQSDPFSEQVASDGNTYDVDRKITRL